MNFGLNFYLAKALVTIMASVSTNRTVAPVMLSFEVRRLKESPFRANRIRDLQSAHHRHSSVARPLGRFVALFDAMLGCAQEWPAFSRQITFYNGSH